MTRTTISALEAIADRINKAIGSPESPWHQPEPGAILRASVGNHHISGTNGSPSLVRMVNENGRSKVILGPATKRELAAMMHAYLSGVEKGKSL